MRRELGKERKKDLRPCSVLSVKGALARKAPPRRELGIEHDGTGLSVDRLRGRLGKGGRGEMKGVRVRAVGNVGCMESMGGVGSPYS
jgi:hypothetical protein